MNFEFHPDQWLDLIQRYPVLLVLWAGTTGGVALTQTAKKTYLAFASEPIVKSRYEAGVNWFAVLTTFAFTNALWVSIIAVHNTGLHWVVSAVAGAAAPYSYKATRAAIAWKFPDLARRLGDESEPDPDKDLRPPGGASPGSAP